MRYDPQTRTIEFELTACHWCDGAKVAAAYVPCPTCQGTGKGVRGGRNGCKRCNGMRSVYSDTLKQTCRSCDGTGTEMETPYDNVPREGAVMDAISSLPVIVRRSQRGQSFNEQYLGFGSVTSVTDYGAHDRLTDDQLIAKVRADLGGYHQVLNFCDKATGVLVDGLVIDCARNGYSVRAYTGTALVAPDSRTENYGLASGMAIANAGHNGTLAAAMLDEATLVPLLCQHSATGASGMFATCDKCGASLVRDGATGRYV